MFLTGAVDKRSSLDDAFPMETIFVWTLGDRLAKARRMAGVSTAEMASHLGVSRKTVNNYESDRTPVRMAIIRAWADKCGVPVEVFEDEQGDSSTIWSGVIPETATKVAA